MKTLLKCVVAAAVFALGAGLAQATTYDLNLTGQVSNAWTTSFDGGGTHYDQWSLTLDPFAAITVSNGDTINATITLDQSVTIPASVTLTWFQFELGTQSNPGDTGTNGTTSLFNNSSLVTSGGTGTGTGTTDWLANAYVIFPPNNVPITFDSVTSNFTISKLASPTIYDSADIFYSLHSPSAPVSAVPEPGTMMLLGFGMAGLAVYGKRRSQKA